MGDSKTTWNPNYRCFDAMTTDRPYRKGMPAEQAAEAIAAEAGKQFDPEIALLFVRLVRSGDIQVFKN